jgi:hypothetical protein
MPKGFILNNNAVMNNSKPLGFSILGMKAAANWNKIGKHEHAYETTPGASTRGVVGIAQDVRLKLQIVQTMLDYIADADDTGELAAA